MTWSVYLINANGTGLYSIAIEARAPAWSRDGRKLAYEDLVTPYGEALGVAIDSINGLRVRFKAFNADSRVGPVRSPRANELAFGSRGSLCTVRADGTGRRRLTRGRAPTGSPDGTSIVFVRGGSVSQRLVVVDRLDSGPRWLGRTGSIVFARCMCPG